MTEPVSDEVQCLPPIGPSDGKHCRKCGIWKSRKEFAKNKKSPDGMHWRCKQCRHQEYLDSREHILEQNRQWRENNHERFSALVKRWHRENPDRVRASVIRQRPRRRVWEVGYYQRTRDTRREWEREYRLRPGVKEQKHLNHQKYRRANRGKVNAWNQARRAKKLSSGIYLVDEWVALCEQFGNRCLACGAQEITVDHVIPLTMEGTNTIDNLQPLCRTCNSKKGMQTIDYRPDYGLVEVKP